MSSGLDPTQRGEEPPTDRLRIRLRGRYAWENGAWVTASYGVSDYENNDSGYVSDNARTVVRAGYSTRTIDVSAGYSNVDMESSVDQLLEGTTEYPINYTADADFVDATVRYSPTRNLLLVGSVYLYENSGTFGVQRQDYRAAAEYSFLSAYLVGLSYRQIDYDEDDVSLNAYVADLVELSVGYRF